MKLFRDRIWAAFAAVTALCMMLTTAVHATAETSAYGSIVDLKAQTDEGWHQTYQTVRNETVSVDCAIIVPSANKASVLRVAWYPPLESGFFQEFPEAEWPKTFASSSENTTVFLQSFQNTPKPKERETDTVKTFLPLEDVDWDAVYPRGSDLSAKEAYSVIEDKAREVYTKYGAYGYYPMELAYGVSIQEDVNKNGPVRDMGYYAFFGFETMRDIPIVANAPFSYGTMDHFDYECLNEPRYYILRVESQSAFGLAAHLFAEDTVLYEDIPLIGFDACKPQIEKLITDGRIRTVYNVRLGYAVYLEPDHNRTFYRLVPSWVVECEYYDSPQDETEPLEDPEYVTSAHFRKLVINAQTGVMLDPQNKTRDRSDCPPILTWDDVQ